MLGATAFLLGVAGLFGSAAMMGAENSNISSSGGYGIPRYVPYTANGPASTTINAVNGTTSLAPRACGRSNAKRSGGSMSTRTKVFPYRRDTSTISAAGISGTPASMGDWPR